MFSKYLNQFSKQFNKKNNWKNLFFKKSSKKIKLVNLEKPLDKRLIRNNLTCSLVNRIYFKFELFKNENNSNKLILSSNLVYKIRSKSYKKHHNYIFFNEKSLNNLFMYFFFNYKETKYRQFKKNPEIISLQTKLNNPKIKLKDVFMYGIHYDKNGRPFYGKWRNTLFVKINNHKLRSRNMYRHVDSKIFNPKFCLDFYPCSFQSNKTLGKVFFNLKNVFKTNFSANNPFNFHFTSFKKNYNELLEAGILDRHNQNPCFIDFCYENIYEDLNKNNLNIIVKNGERLRNFDPNSNYLLPVYHSSSDLYKSQEFYYKKFEGKPNVKFVCIPFEDYLEKENVNTLAFSANFYLLHFLKSKISFKESVNNTFYKEKQMISFYDEKKDILEMNKGIKLVKYQAFDSLMDDLE